MAAKKVVLIVMDGWAHGPDDPAVNAIAKADTPFVDGLYSQYPHCKLKTHSGAVGLPEGQMGNSEVGHMNLGAGRIVYQQIVRINKAIEDSTLAEHPVIQEAVDYAKKNNKPIHLMGLVSDGGVHSHINHLKGLCDILNEKGVDDYYIHAFTDGRDTDPHSGLGFIEDVQEHLKEQPGQLASVIGRYYAMDRDKRWERTKKAYDLLTKGKGKATKDLLRGIKASYDEEVTDEFIKPIVRVDENGKPIATIQQDDVVLCFNFRTDRGRQITKALTQQDFPDYNMEKLPLYYITMTEYDKTFEDIKIIMAEQDLKNTLGEVLARHNKKQLRIAETEKYPHVTYFFSGRREEEFEGEKRIVIPSPKVATYDLKPEMSAFEVRDALLQKLNQQTADFVCLNFANPDMVAHTGVFEATVKAVETIDQCTKAVVETGLENGYTCLVTSDHGNADVLKNPDGSPNTAHTKNPVPCFLVDKDDSPPIQDGKLGDIAPTILKLMELPIPDEMSGHVLI